MNSKMVLEMEGIPFELNLDLLTLYLEKTGITKDLLIQDILLPVVNSLLPQDMSISQCIEMGIIDRWYCEKCMKAALVKELRDSYGIEYIPKEEEFSIDSVSANIKVLAVTEDTISYEVEGCWFDLNRHLVEVYQKTNQFELDVFAFTVIMAAVSHAETVEDFIAGFPEEYNAIGKLHSEKMVEMMMKEELWDLCGIRVD